MTEAIQRLTQELALLPAEQRAELARFLIHSLNLDDDESQDAEDVEAAWDAELAVRAKEIASGEAVGEPAETVFKRLREKYQ